MTYPFTSNVVASPKHPIAWTSIFHPFLVHAWVPAAARGPEPRDESTAAACSSVGTGPSSQGTAQLESSPSLGQGLRTGKRKIEDPAGTSVEAEKASEGSTPAADDGEEKPRAKRNRCFTCRKKLGLTGFDCRCGNVFCGAHRYSDLHGCTFDYRAEAAAKIKKENPVVIGEKIQKI